MRTRANTQLIDLDACRAENIAEFVAFGIDGSLNILGSAEVMPPELSSSEAPAEDTGGRQGATRIFVEFKEFILSWGDSLNLRVPLSWIKPTGGFVCMFAYLLIW